MSPANGNNLSSLVDSISEEISSSNKGSEKKRGKEKSRQANKGVKADLEKALNLKTGEKVKCKKCGIELKFFGTSSLASHINSVYVFFFYRFIKHSKAFSGSLNTTSVQSFAFSSQFSTSHSPNFLSGYKEISTKMRISDVLQSSISPKVPTTHE